MAIPSVRATTVLLAVLIAACSSTPSAVEEGELDRGDRVAVSEIADRFHLSTRYDESRNRLTLAGPAGRVTLFPRTTVALVNGTRLSGMGRLEDGPDGWDLAPEDVDKVNHALRLRRPAPRPALAVLSSPPVSVAPAVSPVGPPVPTWPTGWRVPLERKWNYIVLHHTATRSGNAAVFDRDHKKRNGWDGLGYHFVIGNGRGARDGQVEVGYRWTQQVHGAHAGRGRNDNNEMNETGIGIGMVGDYSKTRPTGAQIASLRKLVDFLKGYCRIPDNHVLLHRDVKRTECPGRHFPSGMFLVPGREIPRAFR